jgi:alkanesulfonate monooxygenase SsuD/methylene tetrahydromethanopterin reductase-like flavin-dependent oxidoreductase (luciferase family)
MHIGLMMECDYRQGRTQEEAFDEAFATAENAEKWGIHGVWLAERHFAPPGSGRAIPSVVASPLIFATAIAARTSHIRVGTAVLVLPLGHPVRMAEEVSTLDNISRGRLDLGIGRSGFPWAYDGYNIPYSESRDRFREYFEVMKLAWTQERFSYQGQYYKFQDVCLIPKPYQKPYPPLRYACSTRETFPAMGRAGMPIFAGLGGASVPEVAQAISEYRTAWREAGHPGEGDVMLRLGIYVAEDMERALSEPRESTMRYYNRIRQGLIQTAESFEGERRALRAQRLASITYEDALEDRLVYGTPETVTHRLEELRDELGLSGIIMEPNIGSLIPPDRLVNSIRLFGQEVAPRLQGESRREPG